MANFTKTYQQQPYSTISPLNLDNNQSGRTVVITGASEGIGFSIAGAFAAAEASRVILLGRREGPLIAAANSLKSALIGTATQILGHVCDIGSEESVNSLWNWLSDSKIIVDVLVLNAGETAPGPILADLKSTWSAFETNVLANLRMTQGLLAQQRPDDSKLILLNISSFMAHSNPAPGQGAYSASKAGFANLLQHLAEERPAEKVQIINIHPGAILTNAARRHGLNEDSLPWDDANLPGHFCVWASTEAARFLHGRFVWANWDVEELERKKEQLEKEPGMLKIGLQGCEYVDITTIFQLITEKKQ